MSKVNKLPALGSLAAILPDLIRYNIRVIFGSKFIYFLGGGMLFFLLITSISLFSPTLPTVAGLYYQLLFPALLLIFFPSIYGIQNDEDVRILEVLFSIPNYRFKVWMLRMFIILLMVWAVVLGLAFLDYFLLLRHNFFYLSLQLMVPVTFFGTLGFFFSTIIRNGHGAAVLVIVLAILSWFVHSAFSQNPSVAVWSAFFNPFDAPDAGNKLVWEQSITRNRTFMLLISVLSLLWGILNLQKRERFMR